MKVLESFWNKTKIIVKMNNKRAKITLGNRRCSQKDGKDPLYQLWYKDALNT